MGNQSHEFNEMLFMQMLMSLNEAAMIQLGKLVNPVTNNSERNLLQAQGTIDLLKMLQAKTQNNLTEQEQQLLDQMLMNLQMNFAYEQEQEEKSQANATDALKAVEPAAPLSSPSLPDEDDEGDGPDDDSAIGKRPGMEN